MRAGIAVITIAAALMMVACSASEQRLTPPPSPAAPEPTASPTVGPVFAGGDFVWRSTKNAGEDDIFLWDDSTGPGRYELHIICPSGEVRVWANNGPRTKIRCTGAVIRVPVCNKQERLISHARWLADRHGDIAWQLVRVGNAC